MHATKKASCILFKFFFLSFLFLPPHSFHLMNTPSPSYSDSPRTSQTLSSRRRPSTTSRRNQPAKYHHHHQSIVSTSSISSKDSSNYASSRYPSGLTSMTGYTSVEVPSICASPTTSTATSHYQQQQQQHTYDAKQLTEDQFDIIDSLDYDDVDDALLGNASHHDAIWQFH